MVVSSYRGTPISSSNHPAMTGTPNTSMETPLNLSND